MGVPADVEVWPENWSAVKLLQAIRTQWRVAAGGAVGLDYCAAYPLIDRMRLNDDDWHQMLADLGEMEDAALEQLDKNREEA